MNNNNMQTATSAGSFTEIELTDEQLESICGGIGHGHGHDQDHDSHHGQQGWYDDHHKWHLGKRHGYWDRGHHWHWCNY